MPTRGEVDGHAMLRVSGYKEYYEVVFVHVKAALLWVRIKTLSGIENNIVNDYLVIKMHDKHTPFSEVLVKHKPPHVFVPINLVHGSE